MSTSFTGPCFVLFQVLVKKITEHQDTSLSWTITRIMLIIGGSAGCIIALILFLYYSGIITKL